MVVNCEAYTPGWHGGAVAAAMDRVTARDRLDLIRVGCNGTLGAGVGHRFDWFAKAAPAFAKAA
jgi:hypothetical protein